MALTFLDYGIIILYLLVSLGIGLSLRKRAGKNVTSFFLGGRNLPWWIAGTSMVATTFAADTPLAVTELVAQGGIAGNWLWWNMLAGGMLTTFFFARYWRRANILTDIELTELRYSGVAARFLRGFRALYFGVFLNAIIMGWVNLALGALLQIFFDVPDDQLLYYYAAAMLLVVFYTSLSGLLGVAFTDVIQFTIAISGSIVLAYIVVNSPEVGGIEQLTAKLPEGALSFFPTVGDAAGAGTTLSLGVGSFFAYIGIQWWASWYPGNEPGGGGYVAQRMMSTKNEQHAIYATLYFQIAHYCIRPWPWILVALSALVLYPDLSVEDQKLGYVMAMQDYLPAGLKGLLLVAFLAAYMSTISTQLNWGTSYVINDFYNRFINPDAGEEQLVPASRIATLLLMLVALIATSFMNTISGVWQFLIECGAGLGLVLILRWYWWRVNAWSEVAASVTPILAYATARLLGWEFPDSFFFTVGVTTVSWLVVTYVTPTTDSLHLQQFYNKVKPEGNWKPFSGSDHTNARIPMLLTAWISAVVTAYMALFFTGSLIFRNWQEVGLYGSIGLAALLILRYASEKVNIFEE